MPRGDTRGKQNKARVAEAVRGTYPIWNRFSRKENHVDLVRKIQKRVRSLLNLANQEKWYSSLNGTRKSDNVTRWHLRATYELSNGAE